MEFQSLSSAEICKLWTGLWFSKEAAQVKNDRELKRYEPLLSKYETKEPINIYEKIALIILYDQIPRNIYRGTKMAYYYDHIALKLARGLCPQIDKLPFCVRITVLICLVHSEDIEDHKFIKAMISACISNDSKCDSDLLKTLNDLTTNHRERVALFGRIPERNKIIGRESTEEEIAYLKAVQNTTTKF